MTKFTKTSTFIFPLLNIPKSLFYCKVYNSFNKLILSNRFINAYLEDENITDYSYKEYNIFLHINNYQDKNFQSFYDTLCSFPNYVEDYENQGNLIFVFQIPWNMLNDFDLLIKGKYSLISKEAKQLIISNNYYTGDPTYIPLYLSKSVKVKEMWETRLSSPNSIVDLKDQEVWPIINPKKEIITKEILKSISKSKIEPTREF